jgi:ribosomal protein L16 Arg81 hydroxylase
LFLSEILYPVHPEKFRKEILGKKLYWWKAPSGASERYSNLYSWEHFESYMNNWENANHVQMAEADDEKQNGEDGKWDKGRHGKLSKADVYNLWRHGHSIVLPFCEYQSKHLWSVVNTFEKQMPFGKGCANMYCSSRQNSHTFDPHRDSTENFLFHIDGQVKWKFYKQSKSGKPKQFEDIILGRGDLLYIPIGLIHKTQPIGPRLTASVHFQSKPKKVNRDKMYDWYRWFDHQREIKI